MIVSRAQVSIPNYVPLRLRKPPKVSNSILLVDLVGAIENNVVIPGIKILTDVAMKTYTLEPNEMKFSGVIIDKTKLQDLLLFESEKMTFDESTEYRLEYSISNQLLHIQNSPLYRQAHLLSKLTRD